MSAAPGPGPTTVAAAQLESVAGDVEANVATAMGAVREASGLGARLLVLPELFLTGYVVPTPAVVLPDAAALGPLVTASAEHDVAVLVGAATPGTGRPRISQLVVADGEVAHTYDKLHLSGDEQDAFEPGGSAVVTTLDGWDVGLGICYDTSFPEHVRALAVAGAQLYATSVAFFEGGRDRLDLYARARAIDNGAYVVVGALTGTCGDGTFVGGACVVDPEGRVLARAGGTAPGLVAATIDPDVVRATRAAHPMLAEHRTDVPVRRL